MGNRLSPSSRVYPSRPPSRPPSQVQRVSATMLDTSVLPPTSPIHVSIPKRDSGCLGDIGNMFSALFSDLNEELPAVPKSRKLKSSGMSKILTPRKVKPLKVVL